ncbi:cytochrome b [Pseudomonas protegens]|uniref:cytochrome b n=1 Tax=Pseudomonas chlororaphis group TaxID=136842 RepID=UPI003209A8C2
MESRIEIYDSQARYGVISRGLHWAMALAFVWIYSTTGAHYLLAESALDEFLWPTHKQVGLLLMGLLLVRVLWSLLNRHRRPPSLNFAARLGHGLLYVGMFAIPFLGLLRQYGSGRAFSAFGLPVMSGFEGAKIQWMTDLGNNFHSLLGWTLLVLIVGHVAAVILHCVKGQAHILRRMAGSSPSA